MVHSIFQNQDPKHLAAVFQAAILFDPRPSTLIMTLGTNSILPPAWLDSLSIVLMHDDGATQVACQAEYDGQPSSPAVFVLTPKDPNVDLHAVFQTDSRSFYLAVGQVKVTTAQGNIKRLANQTSLKAFQDKGPRDASDLEECGLNLSDLFPSH